VGGEAPDAAAVRLAEVVALLSLGTDLGRGQPMEHMIRACLIALRLGERLGIDAEQRAVVYYSGLLAWVGCHNDAYEQAKWLGDDMAVKGEAHYGYDLGNRARRLLSCSYSWCFSPTVAPPPPCWPP
jgi:hypothetical protein